MGIWDWTRTEPKWSFVVDTEDYAGNFERELTCYVVGRCDAYGEHSGGGYREMFAKDFEGKDPFEDLVEDRINDPGDDGIMRAPMDVAPTPGYENDGAGNHRPIAAGAKPKWPAFNSVAIFLSRKPTGEELSILVRRAQAFGRLPKVKAWDVRPKITGCRLVEERVEIVSHKVDIR